MEEKELQHIIQLQNQITMPQNQSLLVSTKVLVLKIIPNLQHLRYIPLITVTHNGNHQKLGNTCYLNSVLQTLFNCYITTNFLENNTQSEVTNNMLHHTDSIAPIDICCLRNSLISSDAFFNTSAHLHMRHYSKY